MINFSPEHLKQIFLNLGSFSDNEYLDKYCNLIFQHLDFPREIGKTQRHHFIPICYYKQKYNCHSRKDAGLYARSDENNFIINLPYKNHILAHYYLSLFSEDRLLRGLFNAFDKQLRGNPNKGESNSEATIKKYLADLELEKYQELYEKAKALEFRPIICIETQEVFKSIKDASRWLNSDGISKHRISAPALRSNESTRGGYHWAYLEDVTKQDSLKAFKGKPPYFKFTRKIMIICIETQQLFESTKDVEKTFGFFKGSIRRVLNFPEKSNNLFGGYHWAYVDDVEKIKSMENFIGKPSETKEERRERIAAKIRQNSRPRTYSQEYREVLSKRSSKSVVCIETQEIFRSGKEAVRALKKFGVTPGGLSSAISGRFETCGGYHWAFTNDLERIEQLKQYIGKPRDTTPSSIKANKAAMKVVTRKIICIETQVTYSSIAEASRALHTDHTNISAAVNGRAIFAAGYHWAYLDDIERQEEYKDFIGKTQLKERPATLKNKKKVLCIELDKIFDSCKEAAQYFNLNPNTLSNLCNGRRKLQELGGYTWKYI